MRAKNDFLEMPDITNDAMKTENAQTDHQRNRISESEFQKIPMDAKNIDDYLDGGSMPANRQAALGNSNIEQARLKSTQV